MLQEELIRRGVPKINLPSDEKEREKRRGEIRHTVQEEFYGFEPDFPITAEAVMVKEGEEAYGGKGILYDLNIRASTFLSHTSFPVSVVLPAGIEKPPLFLYYSFTPSIADGLGEEVLDNGFGIASLYYENVAPDREDFFQNGVGALGKRNPFDSWGKIAIWAWAGSRVLDALLQFNLCDEKRVAVLGHSRLGKTALLTGALDERFSLVISNDSGAGGIALYRGKQGEKVEDLAKRFPFWFCGNMKKYIGKEEEMPFDSHFLAALVAPRHLYVASASRDDWSDPVSEFLACIAANEAYESLGLPGLVCPDRYPLPGESFPEGNIGFHLRQGTHYLGREDWNHFFAYRRKHEV